MIRRVAPARQPKSLSPGWPCPLPLGLLAVLLTCLLACGPTSAPSSGPSATGSVEPSAAPASPASLAASPVPSASPSIVPSPSVTGAPQTVHAVDVPSVLFAPLYVAIAKGYMQQEGIDLQLDPAGSGEDAMPLLASGQLDVLVGGFSAATFNAVQRGLDLRIVASMGQQPPQGYPSALMVRKDLLDGGEVASITDLRGRAVAISGGAGATGGYWMATKLRPANMTLNDVNVVNMGFPDMVAAFASQAIDAAYPSAPTTTTIRTQGTADYFGGVTAPGASAVGVTFGGAFIKSHPDVGQRFMAALIRGSRDIQGSAYFAPENLAADSQFTSTPVETLRTMDPYTFDPDLRPDYNTLTDMETVFIQEGLLAFSSQIPATQFVDPSFVDAAVGLVGPAPGQ